MSEEIQLRVINYPSDGVESGVRNMVFGPASEDFSILLSVVGPDADLEVVIGNGPATEQVPNIIPDVLREIADVIAELQNSPDFWIATAAASGE